MGNCLKSSNSDDESLLNGSGSGNQPSVHHAGDEPELHPQAHHHSPASSSGNGNGSSSGHQMFYPSPNVSRPASQLTEEEQVKIAQRMGLIQHLPTGTFTEAVGGSGNGKNRECVICMIEFVNGDRVRYLPCMHTYHVECIDDWLMRSFTCPSCMEPVDAALLVTYESH